MATILTPGSNDATQRLYLKIAALEQRIATLERAAFKAPITIGAPTTASADGSVAVDTGSKIWVRVNGVWQSVAVS